LEKEKKRKVKGTERETGQRRGKEKRKSRERLGKRRERK
jgi:hypothetical protein